MNHFRRWTGNDYHQQLIKVHSSRPSRNLYRHMSDAEDDTVFDRGDAGPAATVGPLAGAAATTATVATTRPTMQQVTLSEGESSSEEELLSGDLLRMTRLRADRRRNGGPASSVHAGRKSRTVHFVEREIDPGDTIASLALRYGCKASLMKRINNLMSDQEFYGLRTIKVPVTPNSVVEERLTLENELRDLSRGLPAPGHPATCLQPSASTDGSDVLTVCQQKFISIGSTSTAPAPRCGESEHFLQRMDRDLERIRGGTVHHKNSLEEVTQVLTSKRFRPLVEADRRSHVPKFRVLVLVVVGLLVALPILIVLFVLYGRDKSS